MPRRTIWEGERPFRFLSQKTILESCDARTCFEMALSIVVLPEPFGPIIPTICPGSTYSDTSDNGGNPAETNVEINYLQHVETSASSRRERMNDFRGRRRLTG